MNIEEKKLYADKWFSYLQLQICKEFESLEMNLKGKNKFIPYNWSKKKLSQGGGTYQILKGGKIFDKVGVNKSTVSGKFKLEQIEKDQNEKIKLEELKKLEEERKLKLKEKLLKEEERKTES